MWTLVPFFHLRAWFGAAMLCVRLWGALQPPGGVGGGRKEVLKENAWEQHRSSKERAFLWGWWSDSFVGRSARVGERWAFGERSQCCAVSPGRRAVRLCDLRRLPQLSVSAPFPSAPLRSALFCSILSYSLPFRSVLFSPVPFRSVLFASILPHSIPLRSTPPPHRARNCAWRGERFRLTVT